METTSISQIEAAKKVADEMAGQLAAKVKVRDILSDEVHVIRGSLRRLRTQIEVAQNSTTPAALEALNQLAKLSHSFGNAPKKVRRRHKNKRVSKKTEKISGEPVATD